MRSRAITRVASLALALLALAVVIPATALGVVRFDREWKLTGFGGGEAQLAVDRAGSLVYVADPFAGATGRIVVYDRNGKQLRTLEKATGVDVERPAGVATDSAGNLLVFEGDRNRVQVMTPAGAFVRAVAPTGSTAFDDLAQGIAVDAPTTSTSPTPVRAASRCSIRPGASCARSPSAAASSPTSRWTPRATSMR